MGFYSRVLFPRGCDLLMSMPMLAKHRKDTLEEVSGNILEIGFGTGLNLAHYPTSIQKITTVDVNAGMNALAQKRIDQSSIEVENLTLNGENLPMEDESFDSIVSTWTMCSIKNIDQALCEIYRVLKPGGRLFFIEHGLSCDPNVQKWQNRLNPIQKIWADGCHMNRKINEIIETPKLKIKKLEEFYMEKTPKCLGYSYKGSAIK
ncbi:MAG: class I SAM-dependent methyltransferase [Nitrospinales bacterium]